MKIIIERILIQNINIKYFFPSFENQKTIGKEQ